MQFMLTIGIDLGARYWSVEGRRSPFTIFLPPHPISVGGGGWQSFWKDDLDQHLGKKRMFFPLEVGQVYQLILLRIVGVRWCEWGLCVSRGLSTCLGRDVIRLLKMRGWKSGSEISEGAPSAGIPWTPVQGTSSFGWALRELGFWLEAQGPPLQLSPCVWDQLFFCWTIIFWV